jgi:hypothetical protein
MGKKRKNLDTKGANSTTAAGRLLTIKVGLNDVVTAYNGSKSVYG